MRCREDVYVDSRSLSTVAFNVTMSHSGTQSDLMEQWLQRLRALATQKGRIKGSVCEVDSGEQILVCMSQTLLTGRYDNADFLSSVSLVIVDEAHHFAAQQLCKSIIKFRPQYIIGVTATPKRPDGLQRVLHWYMGPSCCIVERQKGCAQNMVIVQFIEVATGRAKPVRNRDGNIILPKVLTMLCNDTNRNQLIVNEIQRMCTSRRTIIVLSDRRKHLRTLCDLLLQQNQVCEEQVGFYCGETTKKAIARRTADLQKQVLFCTCKMAEEGFDKPSLDCLIFATPKKRVQQAVGRIQRAHADKQTPLIIDFCDRYISTYDRWVGLRKRYYKKSGFTMTT